MDSGWSDRPRSGDPVDDGRCGQRRPADAGRSAEHGGDAPDAHRRRPRGRRRCRSTSRSSRPAGTPLGDRSTSGLLGAARPARAAPALRRGPSSSADDDRLGEPPLLHGAVLDRRPARPPASRRAARAARARRARQRRRAPAARPASTASAGRRRRASGVDDPDVSRLHAVLRVAADGSGDRRCTTSGPPTAPTRRRRARVARAAGRRVPGECCGSATAGSRLAAARGGARSSLPARRRRPPRAQPAAAAPPTDHAGARRPADRAAARERARFPLMAVAAAAGRRRWRWSPSPAARPTCCSCLLSPLMALGHLARATGPAGRRSSRVGRR